MSDFRFGDDYCLDYDPWATGSPDGIDWGTAKWVEIDDTRFVRQRTCTMRPGVGRWFCSRCGVSVSYESILDEINFLEPRFCPNCGAKVEPC